jgi:hypothetical protein
MFMFLGSALFALFFLMIAPTTRAFLLGSIAGTAAWFSSWAPLSYIMVAIVIAAPLVSIHVIRSWPVHVEPPNPMAKYRKDPLDDED